VLTLAAINEANRRVYYTSNQARPLDSQLYSVSVEGSDPKPAANDPGTHFIHANPGGTYYVDSFSSLKRPLETVLCGAMGEQLALLRAAHMTLLYEYDVLPFEIVKVKAPDGTILFALLINPAGFRPCSTSSRPTRRKRSKNSWRT